MRPASSVCQVQKTVAKPTRAPVRLARDELDALALGVGDQRAAHGQQLRVRRRDLVEVAVAAQQREQVVEVLLGDEGDRRRRPWRYVVMPVNWPPVMFSTWPCT